MKIKYDYVNEVIEIEVGEEIGDMVIDMRRKEDSADRKNRRHCLRLDSDMDRGSWNATQKDDPFYNIGVETEEDEMRRLEVAISQLTPAQQKLIDYVYYKGYSMKAFAGVEGVSQQAISKRHKVIINKLKKLF